MVKEKKEPRVKENQGMAPECVNAAFPGGQSQVLVHRQSHHIAGATAIKVAGAGVVDGVVAAPAIVGGESEQAGEDPHGIIGLSRFEKRAVPAVVEDDKGAHQETGCQYGERQGQQVGDAQAPNHDDPKRQVGDYGVGKLPEAAPGIRLLVALAEAFLCKNFFWVGQSCSRGIGVFIHKASRMRIINSNG